MLTGKLSQNEKKKISIEILSFIIIHNGLYQDTTHHASFL